MNTEHDVVRLGQEAPTRPWRQHDRRRVGDALDVLGHFVLLRPVRNPDGDVVDFVCVLANQVLETTAGVSGNDVIGNRLTRFLPEVRSGAGGNPVDATGWPQTTC